MNAPIKLDRSRLDAALARIPRTHELLIDGRWGAGRGGETIERISPAHGVTVSTYARASEHEADLAISAARSAFDGGPWPRMTAAERSKVLLDVASLIERDAEVIALLDCLESGKPIAQARGEIAGAADIWRYAAALARDLHGESFSTLGPNKLGVVVRDPIGVVSIITPWNFPFLIVSQKLPFALAAGCTAVVKPSELTSASTLYLGKLLLEAGLPAGVVNIIAGTGADVGAAMTSDPRVDMISFTGSTRVGKSAMATAAQTLKKVSMELGGKNPQIVFADADLEAALDAAVFGAYFNAGECCNAGSRLIIQRPLAERFVADLQRKVRDVKVGDPLDEDVRVGAIVTPDHLEKIEGYVAEARAAGAEVKVGGTRLEHESGQFMAPTIVDGVQPQMTIAREEVFGPVLSILTFETADEAVAIANSTDYGLSAGVWSQDFNTCLNVSRGIHAGTVWMNTFMDGASELPFGGYKQSGLGRELGRRAVDDYTEEKTLHFHSGPRTAWWVPRPSET
ncbi:aldehyde dehydrogenase family protein [Microvirga ossetica]|uniref:aldehyde dehydrogenase family protein n=1 Tax=Microvirga ossetica TaxID=1882682 RepID=UPI000C160D1A|nr:aldehyde dehydrogenase family protein [Microvirga ossetica]